MSMFKICILNSITKKTDIGMNNHNVYGYFTSLSKEIVSDLIIYGIFYHAQRIIK